MWIIAVSEGFFFFNFSTFHMFFSDLVPGVSGLDPMWVRWLQIGHIRTVFFKHLIYWMPDTRKWNTIRKLYFTKIIQISTLIRKFSNLFYFFKYFFATNSFWLISSQNKVVQWKPDITGMVGPELKSCYSRSLLHPKSRETRTDEQITDF